MTYKALMARPLREDIFFEASLKSTAFCRINNKNIPAKPFTRKQSLFLLYYLLIWSILLRTMDWETRLFVLAGLDACSDTISWLPATCPRLPVTCNWLSGTCLRSPVTCPRLPVACPTLPVTCPWLPVTWPLRLVRFSRVLGTDGDRFGKRLSVLSTVDCVSLTASLKK